MKKKYIHLVVKTLILLVLLTPLFMIINTNADSKPQKGDLKCPDKITKKGVSCKPTNYDSNGRVTSVELTYNIEEDGGKVTILKRVYKTETLGHYKVEFEVTGNVKQEKEKPPVYVMVVIDDSGSMKKNTESAKKAITTFGNLINQGGDRFYLGLIKFSTKAELLQGFDNSAYSKKTIDKIKKNEGYSHAEKGLAEALKNFNNINESNARKYLLFFGDGRYWVKNSSVNREAALDNVEEIKNNNVTVFSVRFKGELLDKKNEIVNKNNDKGGFARDNFGCTWGLNYLSCDTKLLIKYSSEANGNCYNNQANCKYYYYAGDNPADDWVDTFSDIAGEITKTENETPPVYSADLRDEIGNDFSKADGTDRYEGFDIGEITSTTKKVGPFEIVINPTADDGWHKTNENFTFSYKKDENDPTPYFVEDSPEVYWEANNENIYSCSGTARADTTEISEATVTNSYYKKICYEGYEGSKGEYNKGFQVSIKIDNAEDGQKSFGLLNGRGFPVSVKMSTNVRCTYTFDYKKFNEDYNSLNEEYNKAKEEYNNFLNNTEMNEDEKKDKEKELSSKLKDLEGRLTTLNSISDYYSGLVSSNSFGDLESYKDRFEKQEAILRVSYQKNNDYDELKLVPLGDVIEKKIDENPGQLVTLSNNKNVRTGKVSSIYLEMEMGVPEACLSMVTATQEDCVSNSDQLSGGHNFYVDLEESGGSVSVLIPNAGYYGDYNFMLDKDEKGNPVCTFNNSTERLIFREIDLNDPFLKKYNRKIGANYLNSKYNFVNIINSETWNDDNEADYSYSMSKTNIFNIKKDTDEDPSGSYLGKNCEFSNDNKWICELPRSRDYGNQYWFTDSSIKN